MTSRLLVTLAAASALAGCGAGTTHAPARASGAPTAVTVPVRAPDVKQVVVPLARQVGAGRTPPDPPSSVPTRLVGGPLVFRVRGARRGTPGNDEPRLRYVFVYRLNRPQLRLRRDPRDPQAPTPLPAGARTILGNVSLAGYAYRYDDDAGEFDPEQGPDHDDCFYGEVRMDAPSVMRLLDRIPDGHRVRVRIRPLTPRPGGGARLGATYLRHPRMLAMRAEPDDAHLLYDQVASAGALRALAGIGCSATFLP
ncbi:MAG TPA: hypothetical protein VHZ31_02130 [Solirubrobacteraceae bacterium]|jgi:hypothetical protein|nr:hypothetical protein [Solirubrobacteraceae bacterium]